MADAVFVIVIFAFLALCVFYVMGCERIIRGAEQEAAEASEVRPERVGR